MDIIALFWDIDHILFLEVASTACSYKDREHSLLLQRSRAQLVPTKVASIACSYKGREHSLLLQRSRAQFAPTGEADAVVSDKKSAEIRRNPQKHPSKNTRSYSGRGLHQKHSILMNYWIGCLFLEDPLQNLAKSSENFSVF